MAARLTAPTRLAAAALACAAAARAFTPALPPPLLVFYSAAHQDNAVVATLAGAASLDATYSFVHASAPLVSNASTCAGGAATAGMIWRALSRSQESPTCCSLSPDRSCR